MDEYKTYKIEDAAGVAIHRCVVRGSAEGGVKKPSAEGEGKFVGITQEAQATQYKAVAVKKRGMTFAVAADVIAYGDAVYIGDSGGKVKSCQAALVDTSQDAAYLTYVIGYAETAAAGDGDIIKVDLMPFVKLTPIT